MATKSSNGNENLQQAMALLIQNQAAFVSHLRETQQDMAVIRRELEQIKAILLRHDQVLADLPEAIRLKVGFKPGR
ncbi:MAG: hypothetical protein HY644_15640 [Acidobacteria bacterium]|nr:hypothetical protein [Acidobacteriota bacterium]